MQLFITQFVSEPIHWNHPVAWLVYVFSGLNLLFALILFLLRQQILAPQMTHILLEAAQVKADLKAARSQLKQINRQADRGLEQLEELLYLSQGWFIGLLESRFVPILIGYLNDYPSWFKFATKKGFSTALTRVDKIARDYSIPNDI